MVFSGVMNSITDATILTLPVIFLRNLQLPMRQKIGVIMVFMTGGLYAFALHHLHLQKQEQLICTKEF